MHVMLHGCTSCDSAWDEVQRISEAEQERLAAEADVYKIAWNGGTEADVALIKIGIEVAALAVVSPETEKTEIEPMWSDIFTKKLRFVPWSADMNRERLVAILCLRRLAYNSDNEITNKDEAVLQFVPEMKEMGILHEIPKKPSLMAIIPKLIRRSKKPEKEEKEDEANKYVPVKMVWMIPFDEHFQQVRLDRFRDTNWFQTWSTAKETYDNLLAAGCLTYPTTHNKQTMQATDRQNQTALSKIAEELIQEISKRYTVE